LARNTSATQRASGDDSPPDVYNISGFHSSTEVDESDVERHLGNDRPKLLSRKRYAVLHLRERLQSIYDEFTKS
jgi:hypothetical protein